jgi:general transcription factor 3C polypeptide 3 (transcription factor C subunit 4)
LDELRAYVAKLDASMEALATQPRADAQGTAFIAVPGAAASPPAGSLTAQAATGRVSGSRLFTEPGNTGWRRGRHTGPRKAAKPTPEIQYRLSTANDAYLQKDYEVATSVLFEIIRINAETYEAWTLLSTVFEELGDHDQALMCLVYAAHLRHREPGVWHTAAAFALEGIDELDDDLAREKRLATANLCYSAAVRANGKDVVARLGKADVLLQLGQATLAVTEYDRALKHRPFNIRTVRNLADAALDSKKPKVSSEVARDAYKRIVKHVLDTGSFELEEGELTWSDLRIYLEHFGILEQWEEAAKELKAVSRLLLGRRHETYWDRWWDDDREWDIGDERRRFVPEFEASHCLPEAYGSGLPYDLRARLYIYRMKLGQVHEAAVRQPGHLLDAPVANCQPPVASLHTRSCLRGSPPEIQGFPGLAQGRRRGCAGERPSRASFAVLRIVSTHA